MLGNGTGSSANGKGKMQRKLYTKEGHDGGVLEKGAEALEMGDDGKREDNEEKGRKRTKRIGAQGTLDMHIVKRTKK